MQQAAGRIGEAPAGSIGTVVRDVVPVADGVVAIELVPDGGGPLPAWEPGAHIDLLLGPDLVRQYSLCGDPDDPRSWWIAVLLRPDGGGGSRRVHALRPGDRVPVRGPRNAFRLHPAPHYVFVAGGIGITPIRPMVAAAVRAGAGWTLHYGGRSRTTMAFAGELARYGAQVRLHPEDEHGPLDPDAVVAGAPPGALVYCCGPAGLIDAMTATTAGTAGTAGTTAGTLHVERFTAAPAADPAADAAFDVECRASGITVRVPPGVSVLDALEEAGGVIVNSSCRDGVCGTCETGVLAGDPDHRDTVLDDAERAAGEVMMVCVSRSIGPRLVLDI
ncbi:ferredoxin [Pseudonocardia saturnea]|uniref:Ferredoxin n=1 Tax=Pseudonocardia saturnea TaxID=33909 RepID=A0ABQ0S1X9_9PSEU|nr:ferredoxin [Pseudonocardia autotrophica]GEC26914.1 ferredoxin [Pseudonocardia saturnea]